MKLVTVVTQQDDAAQLTEALRQADYRSTRVDTAGGFLRRGNATLFIGVEEGGVFHSPDGGETWARLPVNDPQKNANLEGIGFVDENHGWVGGWGDAQFQRLSSSETTDGGRTWVRHQKHYDAEDASVVSAEDGWFIGEIADKEKSEFLSGAVVLLVPIDWPEPFGLVMIEAMALGCPVISFTRGAAPEIVVHGKTGFLVHNVNEMVRFIPRIDEIDRDVARMYVERNFSAHVMAEKYVKIYKKIIAQSKTHSARKYAQLGGKALVTPPPNSTLAKKSLPVQIRSKAVSSAATVLEAEPGL